MLHSAWHFTLVLHSCCHHAKHGKTPGLDDDDDDDDDDEDDEDDDDDDDDDHMMTMMMT